MKSVRLAALALGLAALALPWFNADGAAVPVYRVPPLFTVTYYVGLATAVVAVVSGESTASLATALLLSTSPAYAYFALRLVAGRASVSAGSLLCIASAALFAIDWAWRLRRERSL